MFLNHIRAKRIYAMQCFVILNDHYRRYLGQKNIGRAASILVIGDTHLQEFFSKHYWLPQQLLFYQKAHIGTSYM